MLVPSWIFEQDYLVFLSFFGWLLVGLLCWTKPLSEKEARKLPWLWFGYYAFSQAVSDFLRTLSFSDPFFRVFNMEVGFEMLGYGLLIEMAIRCLPCYRGRSFFPYAAVAGLFLGLSIEIDDLLYTLIVSFLVSVGAIFLACRSFIEKAKGEGRPELYAIVAGLGFVLPAWLFAPGRVWGIADEPMARFEEFPYFGFYLLLLRILAGWTVLAGLWSYRLNRRIEDVAPPVAQQLRFWGFKVLPGTLAVIVFASYLITSWNGQRARERLASDYLSRAQTASLALEVIGGERGDREELAAEAQSGAFARQMLAIKRVGSDVRSVYLWRDGGSEIEVLSLDRDQYASTVVSQAASQLRNARGFATGEAFLIGPLASNGSAVLNISSPILNKSTGEVAYWLGIDVDGALWFRNVSLSRLQTIIIAGLVIALVLFFLYYQIDHESEADLVLAKERAEAADRAKSEFLAVISHEIRTPLQSVLGYSDLLRSTKLDEKQYACLESIQSEGKILLRIVQDILDFSNLRKANFELREAPVRLRRLIEETFRTIKPMASKRGLKARLEIADEVPAYVMADGVRLRQVLLNLFGNSVKYTEDGEVRLSACYDESAQRPLRFVISDTGVGIKKEDLGRLFEPFIQLEHSSRFPREGAGLGLAIVNRIIELMGGTIQVSSSYGAGSEFTVDFDFEMLEAEEEAFESPRPDDESIAQEALLGKRYPMRILVVDDNPMVRRLIAQYLESLGYQPDLLEGGRPAAETGHQYDLVLMDLRMPGVDGPAAAQRIRERTAKADTPWIVAVSASLQEEEVARAKNAGVNDFLGKPFFASSLAEKIRAMPSFESFYREAGEESVAEVEPAEHRPLFIGPVDPPEEAQALGEVESSKPAMPANVFGAAGSFSKETIRESIRDVYAMHDGMLQARLDEDWDDIREKAHYLSNTAMALDIDQLYLDSKNLQQAAEAKDVERIDQLLPELRLNFQAWESEE